METLVAAVGSVLLATALAMWLLPRREAQRLRAAGITDEGEMVELATAARSSVTQAAGGLPWSSHSV